MERKILRKEFIQKSLLACAGSLLTSSLLSEEKKSDVIMTISGGMDPKKMGFTLTHEHVLADFIGAEKYSKNRYDPEEVYTTALPYMLEVKNKGCNTFVDCSPAYLGRDVNILKRLEQATGLNIITNTGYYGAVGEKFLPPHAYTESAQQLANRWIAECKNGIEGTGIRPGILKTSVDKAPLTVTQRKLIAAAAITHLATGITINVHTGDGKAAVEQLEILKTYNVSPSARIWVHSQNETDKNYHLEAAKNKSWISFDGVNPETIKMHLDYLQYMKSNQLLHRVLVSQDSGWYNVGEPHGGSYKPYTCIFNQFIPALKQSNFTLEEMDLIFKINPAKALAMRVRKL